MIKKGIVTLGVVGLLAALLLGRDCASYVTTSAERVKESVRGGVPIEFEIDRARKMVAQLLPDIRRNMHVIAKEEVEIERLQKEIDDRQEHLARDRTELMTLREDLSRGGSVYHYAGRKFTPDEVKADLARRFERYKTCDATMASLQEIQQARLRSLDAAREKLAGMMAAKRQLEVDVENLEARLKMVEVAQTTSDYHFDDSRLARVRQLVSDIRTRLGVAEKLANADVEFEGEIPLDDPETDDIIDRVTEYFAPGGGPHEEVAAAER
jgi:hypothetical protein